eukprot:6198303-Pleurochrysis_carterae.AAC.1
MDNCHISAQHPLYLGYQERPLRFVYMLLRLMTGLKAKGYGVPTGGGVAGGSGRCCDCAMSDSDDIAQVAEARCCGDERMALLCF